MPTESVPHDLRRYPNPGHPPARWPADTRIGVRFAGGHVSAHTYTAAQLRWTISGHDFDVAEFWRAA